MRKAKKAKAMDEADTVERARAWDETKANEKAEIFRVNAEARERARRRPRKKCGRKIMLFRGQRQRLLPRSDSRRRPKEQRKRGHRLRKGTTMWLRWRKWRRR